MNLETLLGLISGGRYQTSADLPTAHSFMDDLIQKQEAEMSKVFYPAGKNIFGQPTKPITQEDLNNLAMGLVSPGQGAKAIAQGSEGWKQIMTYLRLINPKTRREATDLMNRKISDLPGGKFDDSISPKYKDNPHRELSDLVRDVIKITKDVDMSGPIPAVYSPSLVRKAQSSELIGKSREAEKILNKSLLEGFEEVDKLSKKDLTGYMPQKYEDKIRKWSDTLLGLLNK